MYEIDPKKDFTPLNGLRITGSLIERYYGILYFEEKPNHISFSGKWEIRDPKKSWFKGDIQDEATDFMEHLTDIVNTSIIRAGAANGILEIEFENGAALRLAEDKNFESYEIYAPNFYLLV